MHYLEIPLYSLEFVFVLVSFSDLFRIKSNRRNRTPKQQQWVANFSITTNILPYLTVQIENIFLVLLVYLLFSQSQRGAEIIGLLVSWPKKIAFCFSPKPLCDPLQHAMPRMFWSIGMVRIPLCKPRARSASTVGYPVQDFCRNGLFEANMGSSQVGLAHSGWSAKLPHFFKFQLLGWRYLSQEDASTQGRGSISPQNMYLYLKSCTASLM